MPKGADWTPQMDDRLRALDAEKLTFRIIAARMNADFGLALTRNACIGRARRIGCPLRDGTPPPPPKPRKEQIISLSVRQQPPPLVPVMTAPAVPGAYTMLQLTRTTCRWPGGSKPPYTYCGAPVHGDRPFCLAHCRLAYNKPEKTWT